MSKNVSPSPKYEISQDKSGGSRAVPNMDWWTDGETERHDNVDSRFLLGVCERPLKKYLLKYSHNHEWRQSNYITNAKGYDTVTLLSYSNVCLQQAQ